MLHQGSGSARLTALVLACAASVASCRSSAGARAADPSDGDAALRAELVERMEADQAVREEAMELLEPGKPMPGELLARWRRTDAENTAWIEQVLDAHGWPMRSTVGEDGSRAAFLLVQHADAHPDLQQRALPLLAAAVEAGEAQPSHLALLTDRVRLKEGLLQLYGSQVQIVDGEPVPFEIEDPEHVDERRAAMELEPLAEYLERMRQTLP